mgnify:CR=1 FL=1
MKLKLFFIGVFSTCCALSQTINQPNLPPNGVTYSIDTNEDYLTFSFSGPWDFSSTSITGSREIELVPIQNTPFSSEYPNSTHAMYGVDYVQFPGYTSSGYTYNGEESFLLSNYPTPLVIYPYPFSVGSVFQDGVYDVPFEVPGGPPALFRDHEVITEAVSSGSIFLPNGISFDNVVLVRSFATFTDGQTGSTPCVTTRETWAWWAPDIGVPVAQTFNQVSTGACPPLTSQFTRFYTAQTLGGPYHTITDNEVVVVSLNNNMFELFFQGNSNQKLNVTVYNMLGQLMSGHEYNKTGTNTYSTILDMSKHSSGIYLIKVQDLASNMLKTLRVIVK